VDAVDLGLSQAVCKAKSLVYEIMDVIDVRRARVVPGWWEGCLSLWCGECVDDLGLV
jgi:hypothetical protein